MAERQAQAEGDAVFEAPLRAHDSAKEASPDSLPAEPSDVGGDEAVETGEVRVGCVEAGAASEGSDEVPADQTYYTYDTMFRGRVKLAQRRRGYRFSIDAVLLAHEAAQYKPCPTLDVGAGCGVVPLLLAELWSHHRQQTPPMWGLECQPDLAELAAINVQSNQRSEQIAISGGDVRRWLWPAPGEKPRLITCNPPFFRVDAGRSSPNVERDHARRERAGSLEEIVAAIAGLLHPRGRAVFVYPAASSQRLMAALLAVRMQATKLQWVHPHLDADANLVLLTARFRASPLVVPAPLILYQQGSSRAHTAACEAILAGDLGASS